MANVLLEGWTGEQSVGQRLETLFYSGYKPSGEECHWGRGSIEEKEAKDPSEQTARKILPFWVRISLTKVSARKHKAEQEKKNLSQVTQSETLSMYSHLFPTICALSSQHD